MLGYERETHMMARVLCLCLVLTAAIWGCKDRNTEPVSVTASESASAPVSETEPAPTPVSEMTEPELKQACFEGRQEACDLLGH